jgi:hypothetical protein
MQLWRFLWDYHSSYGHGMEGDEQELSDDLAEAILRDSPGVIVPAEQRMLEEPPQDRMMRGRGRPRKAIASE